MAIDIPNLDSFGVSRTRGFLPTNPPLDAFRDSYYAKWDDLIAALPNLISSHTIGQEIQRLPILDTSKLSTELDLRRAYVVLAFLVHGYVWGGSQHGTPIETIPPQLAEPFLAICDRLGMEPVLSYAGLCLWNWAPKSNAEKSDEDGFFELHQLESQASFTGTRGEDAFYHVPVLIEAEGGHLVSLLLDAVAAAQTGHVAFITDALDRSAETFVRMGKHLPKMYATLDAHMFYHHLRPFLSGGKGMEERGLSRGMVFQRSDGSEEAAKCIGGSAGQSSLFQFLDCVLGVEHKGPGGGKESIFQEMRAYMPGKHRELLQRVSQLPSLRAFVEQNQSNKDLARAYENCMQQLRSWRGKHIAVVSKYIVRPARLAEQSIQNEYEKPAVDKFEAGKGEDLQGTGGSALIPFLRQSRDETIGFGDGKGTVE